MTQRLPLPKTIVVPGKTCWQIARANRVAVIIDSETYFSALKDAFAKARRQILIVGWDFDSGMLLEPQDPDGCKPLGAWLRDQVEARPELEINILIWRNSLLYGSNQEPLLSVGDSWWDHPRIAFHLDAEHPVSASHHQKIVCIDGMLAFVGGMDITLRRWDDARHASHNDMRVDKSGKPTEPVHDIQIAVDGAAAAAVHRLATDRWHTGTTRTLTPVEPEALWPEAIAPQIFDHPVGIARTIPHYGGHHAVHEIEKLNLAMLKAAKHSIYIESQYFTVPGVARVIKRHLKNPNGPEVIILTNAQWQGWLEKYAMGENRNRLFRRMKRADKHKRLGLYYPVTGPGQGMRIKVHSKLMIIDDRAIRIGSSNLNSRSLGTDTECDIVVEAETDEARRTIADTRNRLLAEHVGTTPELFAEAAARTGSLRAAIQVFNGGERRLTEFIVRRFGETALVLGTSLFDPRTPLSLRGIWTRLFGARIEDHPS